MGTDNKEDYLLNYSYKAIESWWEESGNPVLNVVTTPYNTTLIFSSLIEKLLNSNKKILFITNEEEKNNSLLKYIRRDLKFKNYSYFKKGNTDINANIIFVSHEDAIYFKNNYDLILYDNISCYSSYTKLEISELLNFLYKSALKIITYSAEVIFLNSPIFDAPWINGSYPFREPRILTTRIDLRRDIPYLMYDYLSWFSKLKRKVIIYTPDEETSDRVYSYLMTLKDNLQTLVHNLKALARDKNVEYLLQAKDQSLIIVTCNYEDTIRDMQNIDIVVFGSDNSSFDCKKLVFFCGKASLYNKIGQGEVLLISNEVTGEMEKAKELTRRFNKLAWERGFFS